MNPQLYFTRFLPNKMYFPWHPSIKRQLTDLQERFDLLKMNFQKNNPASKIGVECFILCCKRPTRSCVLLNDPITRELVPCENDEQFKKQGATVGVALEDVRIGDIFFIPYNLACFSNCSKSLPVSNQIIVVAMNTNEYKDAIVCFKESSNVTVSYLEDLKKHAGLILEQTMFRQMKSNAEFLLNFLQQERFKKSEATEETIPNWKDCEGLFNEIMGLFRRSRIPEHNKPKSCDLVRPAVSEKVSADLFGIDSSVKSCGYRYRTLQVFVDDPSNEKINKSIKYVLEKHLIRDFEIVPSIATYKPLLGVGAKAKPKENGYGSVGGFAKWKSRMCALISRHVALRSEDGQVVLSDSETSTSVRSSLIQETVVMDHKGPVLDISAALIPPEDTYKCETKFKSENGVPTNGKKCTYEGKDLDNRRVHLWGATTAPGLGIITIPEILDRDHNNAYIVVENRVGSSERLCNPGDSGAMVCADDDYGSGVECISMLIGEDQGKYATFRIDKGLEQLERQTNTPFELIKE